MQRKVGLSEFLLKLERTNSLGISSAFSRPGTAALPLWVRTPINHEYWQSALELTLLNSSWRFGPDDIRVGMAGLRFRSYRRLCHWLSRTRIAGHSRGKVRPAMYDNRQVRVWSLRRRVYSLYQRSHLRWLVNGQYYGGSRGLLCHDEHQTPVGCLHPHPRYRVFEFNEVSLTP